MKTFLIFWRLARNFLAQLAILSLVLEQLIFVSASSARAADLPITPDGSTNTQIDHAANGVPIVNIVAPNAGGLSHNKFNDYNVNQGGLILNNAIGSQNGIIQTQIGGLINDNANLANSGAASIILNEVTSSNISQINGYTEIAGKKADLVLANPNGFVMNGAGFVNVSRFTAAVGSSNQFNPNPADLTFRLSDNAYAVTHGFLPKLTIMGAGIDLENVTSTDLVANLMNIVAPVYAGNNDVNFRAGDQAFNYLTKEVVSDNANRGSNLPDEVAIDASALGKIQAGRIFIIATKEGFGIKYSGDLLASRAGIVIDNQGNITYNNIASEAGNIEVTSRKGSITQNGISHAKDSASDIRLNAFGNIINSGQFVSARNINLETKAAFRNESAALNLSDDDFTIDAVDFVNLGQISANRDLEIKATTLNNSAKLVAGRNLTLTAPQITNEDSIYANNKITITAANYLTNNKEIISLGKGLITAEDGTVSGNADDGIVINAKTLNNNRDIKAKNNIAINTNDLNNNTAGSAILALKNISLNAITIDNSNANIQAGRNLTLRNLTLNSPVFASRFGVTSQATSITNAGGAFYAGTLLDFDLGNADYTILGKLESAGSTKIKAVNVTNKTNLKANSSIEIIATDKFTNGVFSGDNSNNKIVAGTALTITASNLLSNYGTVSSGTDLSLTSRYGNINNNVNAEIIAGKRYKMELEDGRKAWINTGALSLSAKNGAVNQNSLNSIVANGDYSLDVVDFVNTGRVDVAGNLTLNVSRNLVNEAYAMIFSGGNMNLNVVGSLTNNYGAVIYSEGNLTIQKYASTNPLLNPLSNRTFSLTNYGNIETYLGKNIVIKADTFLNSRTVDPIIGLIGTSDDCVLTGGGGIDCGATTEDRAALNHGLYSWRRTGGDPWGEFGYTTYYEATQGSVNPASKSATISSGGTLDIDSGAFTNYISEIYSKGNMTISANNTDNFNKSFTYGKTVTLKKDYDGIGPWTSWCGGGSPCRRSSYSFSNFSTYLSYIKSGGSLRTRRKSNFPKNLN